MVGVFSALLALSVPAEAAGYRYLRLDLESDYGTEAANPVEAGFGLSLYSDGNRLSFLFGDDTGPGGKVRRWGLDGRVAGPVIGVPPPDFEELEGRFDRDWLMPWKRYRVGGDADEQIYFTTDLVRSLVFNGLALLNVDPHVGYLGVAPGIGLAGTWWNGWKGAEHVVMTGKLTAEARVVGGVTLRDAFYVQGWGGAYADLFGVHQREWEAAGTVGGWLQRLGIPVGAEVTGRWHQGDDNVDAADKSGWTVGGIVYVSMAPPYLTRMEERIEKATRNAPSL